MVGSLALVPDLVLEMGIAGKPFMILRHLYPEEASEQSDRKITLRQFGSPQAAAYAVARFNRKSGNTPAVTAGKTANLLFFEC